MWMSSASVHAWPRHSCHEYRVFSSVVLSCSPLPGCAWRVGAQSLSFQITTLVLTSSKLRYRGNSVATSHYKWADIFPQGSNIQSFTYIVKVPYFTFFGLDQWEDMSVLKWIKKKTHTVTFVTGWLFLSDLIMMELISAQQTGWVVGPGGRGSGHGWEQWLLCCDITKSRGPVLKGISDLWRKKKLVMWETCFHWNESFSTY